MICKFCGERFEDELRECPNCRISIDETGVSKEADYICPVCGAENPPEQLKCSFCCSIFPNE